MKCPFCAEEIQDAAIVCRFCNHSFQTDEVAWARFITEFRALQRDKQIERWNALTEDQKRHFSAAINPQPAPIQNTVRLWSPGIAAVLSLIIPGAGQMYKGRTGVGFLWLFGTAAGYLLFIVPGVICHIICIIQATQGNPYREGG